MNLMTPEISKKLGFSKLTLERYPTIEQVEKESSLSLCRWYRFLRSPENESEEKISKLIYDKVYPKEK